MEYLAGNKLICNNEIKHYPCDLNYRLADYDTSPECSEFVQQVMISCDSTLCSFLIASMVPYVLFLINPSERHRYDPVFFVHKKSELGQLFTTEICKVFFNMYVYKDDPTRPADMFDICCDPKDLNTASQFHDCSLYFDGLRILGVKEIDKKSKLNAVTLINRKRGVNNSPSEGMNSTFSSSIVISSDFLFDKLPLLTRCVVIPHDTKCSKKTITWFKEHATYLRGIKILFIQYLESNYEELKKKVETLLQQKHFKTSKYSSPSLCDSRTIMYVTAELFFEFYDDLRKTFSHDTEINGVGESKDSDTEDYWNSYETSLDPTSSSALDHEDDELDIFQSSSVTDMFFKRIDDSIEYTDKIISSLRNDWKQKLIDKFIWNLTSGKASFITTDIDRFQDDILNTENGFPQKFVFHDVEKKRFYVKAKHLENYFFTLDPRKFTGRSILNYFITDNGEEVPYQQGHLP